MTLRDKLTLCIATLLAAAASPAAVSGQTVSAAAGVETAAIPVAIAPDSTAAAQAEVAADTVAPADEVKKPSATRWIGQLIGNGFHINAPDVDYPRFPRFLLKVYNWGDRVFNGYDPQYVVSTGKNWKVLAKSYNWFENYSMIFSQQRTMDMISDLYADIGGYICFMAVSVGYTFNANELIGDRNDTRSNFNFNFTCSRFTIDYTDLSTRGGARILNFGSYDRENLKSIKFEGISNKTRSLTAVYIFNNRRYSHAAAYCFSKYQLRSAGSWLAGFFYNNQTIGLDFNSLPRELLQELPSDAQTVYDFKYRDYVGLGGYGYNWALKPRRWLLNVTALMGVGYKHTSEEIREGSHSMVAVTPMLHIGAVYNHRALFTGLHLRALSNFYFNSNYTFLSALCSVQLTVGARF